MESKGPTISRAPFRTPQSKLEYTRALWPSGSSTKSVRGLFSISRENSSSDGLQLLTRGVIPRYILKAT